MEIEGGFMRTSNAAFVRRGLSLTMGPHEGRAPSSHRYQRCAMLSWRMRQKSQLAILLLALLVVGQNGDEMLNLQISANNTAVEIHKDG